MLPWVGKDYEKSNPKVLILGLSVYGGRSRKNRIQDMIESVKENEWTHSFFTKVLNTFNDEDHWLEINNDEYYLDRNTFWNSMAFYEYLLHVFKKAKDAIDKKYYEEAKEPFIEVVQVLKPDIILCMGYSTYDNLPEMGKYFKTYNLENEELEVWEYSFASKRTFALRIKHPSNGRGFNSDNWSNIYNEFRKDIGY